MLLTSMRSSVHSEISLSGKSSVGTVRKRKLEDQVSTDNRIGLGLCEGQDHAVNEDVNLSLVLRRVHERHANVEFVAKCCEKKKKEISY